MPLQTLIYLFLAVFFSLGNLWLADRLRKNFNAPYLNTLFYFLIAFNLLNVLNWIGYKVIFLYFHGANESIFEKVNLVYSLFIVPVFLLVIYFYLTMFFGLLEKRIPLWLNVPLITGMGYFLLYYLWLCLANFNNPELTRIELFWIRFDAFGAIYFIAVLSVFLVINLFHKDDFKRRKNRSFILSFLLIVVVLYLTPISWLQVTWKDVTIDLLAILFFVSPLLPLWVAKTYHQQYIRLYPDASASLPDLQTVCRDFGVSRREGEVLEMVIAGKSRREIEAALFISDKTVKNHLYNSYKKLGVKNRVQLLNLFHNLQKKQQ